MIQAFNTTKKTTLKQLAFFAFSAFVALNLSGCAFFQNSQSKANSQEKTASQTKATKVNPNIFGGQFSEESREEFRQLMQLYANAYYEVVTNEDYEKATQMLNESCNRGLGTACYLLVEFDENGNEEEDTEIAAEKLKHDCLAPKPTIRSGASCATLAELVIKEDVEYADVIEQALYDKGCQLNDPLSCARYAAKYLKNEEPDLYKRYANKAIRQAALGCNHGMGFYCLLAANTIQMLYQEDKDGKAKGFWKRGCELKDGSSCYMVKSIEQKEKLERMLKQKQEAEKAAQKEANKQGATQTKADSSPNASEVKTN
ncbi:hypothetical protein [Helicobacter sp. T3_23-1056]